MKFFLFFFDDGDTVFDLRGLPFDDVVRFIVSGAAAARRRNCTAFKGVVAVRRLPVFGSRDAARAEAVPHDPRAEL